MVENVSSYLRSTPSTKPTPYHPYQPPHSDDDDLAFQHEREYTSICGGEQENICEKTEVEDKKKDSQDEAEVNV